MRRFVAYGLLGSFILTCCLGCNDKNATPAKVNQVPTEAPKQEQQKFGMPPKT